MTKEQKIIELIEQTKQAAINNRVGYQFPNEAYIEQTGIILVCNHFLKEIAALESEPEVSDEDIEKYFTSQHYDSKNGHHYRINKDRILGAKAMRDGLIKSNQK